jgi:hypothetical protein
VCLYICSHGAESDFRHCLDVGILKDLCSKFVISCERELRTGPYHAVSNTGN